MKSSANLDTAELWSLELTQVERRTPSQKRLLRVDELVIDAGDRLGVSGDSGSGKSTLLRVLARLDPIQAGRMLWCQRPLIPKYMPSYRRQVMYVSQSLYTQCETVLDALEEPYRLAIHQRNAFSQMRMEGYLDQLRLPLSFLDQATHRLSTGESNLVRTLQALQLDPALLLLDEPTSGLDEQRQTSLTKMLTDWLDESKARGLVIVSHDHQLLETLTTRRAKIVEGNLAHSS